MMNDLNDDNLRRRRHNDVATIRFLLEEALIFSSESAIQRRRQSSHFTFEERDMRRERSFVGIFPLLRRFLLLWVFGLLLIVLSACEYFVFYKLVMPGLHTSQILAFDYTGLDYQTRKETATKYVDNTCERNTANTTNTNTTRMVSSSSSISPLRVSEQEDENYRQLAELAPFAVVDLFATHQSWQHKIPDIVPRLNTRKHILTKGMPHYIEIILDLPESDLNRKTIGMFNVVVELLSSETGETNTHYNNSPKKLLATSTRTTRIPFESLWISNFRKSICIVPYMVGVIQENRRVVVPSYRYFVESAEFPLRYVKVRLLMSPEKAQRGELVEVVQGMVNIGKELTDVQLVLKEWFLTCLTFGTTFFFFLQLVLIFATHYFWKCRKQRQHIILEDDVSENLGLDVIDDIDDEGQSNRSGNPINESFDENETSSSQGLNNSRYSDEQGEWEDLPQPTRSSSQAPGTDVTVIIEPETSDTT